MSSLGATPHEAPDFGFYWDYASTTRMGRYITCIEERFVGTTVNAQSGRRRLALDLGAGSGRLTRVLARLFDHVIATETNPLLLRTLCSIAQNVHPLAVSPKTRGLPFADGAAGLITCIEVADIVQQPWFFSECARVLCPGGLLIFTSENRRSWKGFLAQLRRGRYHDGRRAGRYYSRSLAELLSGARSAGLSVERSLGFNWVPLTRASNSPLVGPLVRLEGLLGLRQRASVSPWGIVSAARPDHG